MQYFLIGCGIAVYLAIHFLGKADIGEMVKWNMIVISLPAGTVAVIWGISKLFTKKTINRQ